jgi:hypothetical protein
MDSMYSCHLRRSEQLIPPVSRSDYAEPPFGMVLEFRGLQSTDMDL